MGWSFSTTWNPAGVNNLRTTIRRSFTWLDQFGGGPYNANTYPTYHDALASVQSMTTRFCYGRSRK
jgi:hypothetical protein